MHQELLNKRKPTRVPADNGSMCVGHRSLKRKSQEVRVRIDDGR